MELTEKELKEFFDKSDKETKSKGDMYFNNIGKEDPRKELTEDNIKALLEWKDPRFLSDPTKKGKPNKNKKVQKVLDNIEKINKFRKKKELTEEEKKEFENMHIFDSGDVYNTFIKHIARPLEYPIYDTHVLNAFLRLKLGYSKQDLYNEYKKFFFALYEAAFGKDEPETVERMKEVDNALFNYDKYEKTGKKVDEALKRLRLNPNQTKED